MTHFTVAPTAPRVQHTAALGVLVYAFPFPIIDPEDIAVYVGPSLVESGYSVTGSRLSSGGTVTFDAPVEAGAIITIIRERPIRRMTDFADGGEFRADAVNDELDSLTMIDQQLAEGLSRTIHIDQPGAGVDLSLPVPLPSRRAIISAAGGSGLTYTTYDPDTTVTLAQQALAEAQQALDKANAALAMAAGAGVGSRKSWGPFVLVAGVQLYPLPAAVAQAHDLDLYYGGVWQDPAQWTITDELGVGKTLTIIPEIVADPAEGQWKAGVEIKGMLVSGLTSGAIGNKVIQERHIDDGAIDLNGRLIGPGKIDLAGHLIAAGPPNKQLRTNGSGIIVYADYEPSSGWTNIKKFGALGIGSDDTAAINAAIDSMPTQVPEAGGCLYFPPGWYGINANGIRPKAGMVLGIPNASRIIALSATGDVITLAEQKSHVEGLEFWRSPLVVRQSGHAAIKITTASVSRVRMCRFNDQSHSIWVTDQFGAQTTLESLEIIASVPDVSICIQIDAGYDVAITDTIITNNPAARAGFGILVTNCGDLEILNTCTLECNVGLNVFTAPGKVVASLWGNMCFFDNCGRGASMIANGGAIVRSVFNQCWFSSAKTDHGFHASTSVGGVIDGVAFTNCDFYLNAANGCSIYDGGVRNVDLTGCRAGQNGQSGFAMGVNAGVPVHDWSVIGCKAKASAGVAGNGAYGLFAIPGHTGARVHLNDFRGNGAGPWSGVSPGPNVTGNFT